MSRSRSSSSVTTGQLLLRLSIPLFIVAAAVAGFLFVVQRMTSDVPRTGGGAAAESSTYVEAEWIPDAVMGSLLPGRFAFEPGEREVVVISRVTERRPLEEGEIDRLWLELSPEWEIGKPVELSQLMAAGDVGLDRGVYRKGVFSQVPRLSGQMTLRQRHDSWLVLELDAELSPLDGPAWRLPEFVVAYRTPRGRHARQADGSREAPPAVPVAAPAPVADIVGQWYGDMVHAGSGESWFDAYYQFNADGSFAHSTGRSGGVGDGYSAGMKYGTWRLHGDKLVMKVDIFVFDEPKNNDHLFGLQGQPLIILKVVPVEDSITFTGQFLAPGNHDVRITRLRRTHVPDLFTHRPNPNRRPGFYERPMPSPGDIVPRGVVAP